MRLDVVVVGAGVVGLAVARELANAGREVMVIERNERIGAEISARNSEVIHAGLYYPPGSLRARLCVEGKARLYAFAEERGVSVRRCGKLLVATQEAEVSRLEAIARTAEQNGVKDLAWLSGAEARQLEPELSCIAAVLSPSTGVIDSHGLMLALDGEITTRGGEIVLNAEVVSATRMDAGFRLEVVSGGERMELECAQLVLAAGLGGTRLGQTLAYETASYRVPETYPAKGHYFTLSGRQPFSRLVYPMPSGAWLGVHVTIDVAGQSKFGPDCEWKDAVTYEFEDSDGRRLAAFADEIRRYWPGLPEGALAPGYTGVRPKLYREGEAAADFVIHGRAEHGVGGLVALYGIESPGLTSSLAIGALVAERLAE